MSDLLNLSISDILKSQKYFNIKKIGEDIQLNNVNINEQLKDFIDIFKQGQKYYEQVQKMQLISLGKAIKLIGRLCEQDKQKYKELLNIIEQNTQKYELSYKFDIYLENTNSLFKNKSEILNKLFDLRNEYDYQNIQMMLLSQKHFQQSFMSPFFIELKPKLEFEQVELHKYVDERNLWPFDFFKEINDLLFKSGITLSINKFQLRFSSYLNQIGDNYDDYFIIGQEQFKYIFQNMFNIQEFIFLGEDNEYDCGNEDYFEEEDFIEDEYQNEYSIEDRDGDVNRYGDEVEDEDKIEELYYVDNQKFEYFIFKIGTELKKFTIQCSYLKYTKIYQKQRDWLYQLAILLENPKNLKFFYNFLKHTKFSELIIYYPNKIENQILLDIVNHTDYLEVFFPFDKNKMFYEQQPMDSFIENQDDREKKPVGIRQQIMQSINKKYTSILQIITFNKLIQNQFSLFRIMYDLFQID